MSWSANAPAGAAVHPVAIALSRKRPRGKVGNALVGGVFVQIGNAELDRSVELRKHVADIAPGSEAALKVFRNSEPLTMPPNIG